MPKYSARLKIISDKKIAAYCSAFSYSKQEFINKVSKILMSDMNNGMYSIDSSLNIEIHSIHGVEDDYTTIVVMDESAPDSIKCIDSYFSDIDGVCKSDDK